MFIDRRKRARVLPGLVKLGALAAMVGVLASAREARADGMVYKNWAVGRDAFQSTTGWGGIASRAVDGNTNGNFWNNSVTHTSGTEENPWWILDLGSGIATFGTAIDKIVIYNRTDCCAERLDHFYFVMSDNPITPGIDPATGFPFNWNGPGVSTWFFHDFPDSGSFTWNPNRGARYFEIVSVNGQRILSLAEVEIYRSVWVVG
jgi:hypothetical protein